MGKQQRLRGRAVQGWQFDEFQEQQLSKRVETEKFNQRTKINKIKSHEQPINIQPLLN